MPPQGQKAQKGTGSKKGRDVRQSRSRNTTPIVHSSAAPSDHTSYLCLPIEAFDTSEDIIKDHGNTIPNSRDLEALLERLNRLVDTVERRGSACDRGMRLLAQAKKDRNEEIESERRKEEIRERMQRDAADEEERERTKASRLKRKKDNSTVKEERPLTHGAHTLAPQDGSNLDPSTPLRDKKSSSKLSRDNDSASSSLSPPAGTPTAGMDIDHQMDKANAESSEDERQPPPAPAIVRLQTFGDDPTTFPDPTVYEIRKDTEGLTREQLMKIYSVADFPTNTLEDLIAGSPPDKDFSNAKPTNQVQANTFATYLEPYFRPFTEEDLAFLRERGDRVTSFVVPRRGKKHYTEAWAEEDGILSVDAPHQSRDKLPANQPRGGIEDLNDDNAQSDRISAGPILSRLLATLRPEHRAPPAEEKAMTNGLTNGEANIDGEANGELGDPMALDNVSAPIPPSTYMPDSNSESWKKTQHVKLDYAQIDERIKQELRHIGFLPEDTEPDYDGHFDDEVAARMRYLQAKLKEVSIMNGARKARLMELTKERMAHQEFTTILEDLDGQVNTAYLKRTRTLGKNKKAKRPGGAGGGSHFVAGGAAAVARPGIGDVTRTLMDRRVRWNDTIQCVLDPEASRVKRVSDPDSSIFTPQDMAEYVRKEKEGWDEEEVEE